MIVISICAYSKGMNSDSNEPLVNEDKQICDVGLESSPLGLYRYQVCKVKHIIHLEFKVRHQRLQKQQRNFDQNSTKKLKSYEIGKIYHFHKTVLEQSKHVTE